MNPNPSALTEVAEPPIRRLATELDQLKRQHRATVEAYEAALEELKAANEELQATNEELRAVTDELEASRQELSTVDQALKAKVDELGRANGDLQNLMASTDIATLFLDRTLRIQRYTPAAVRLFSLIPSDLGRPLSDLSHRLEDDFVAAEARRVLDTLAPVEREARSQGGEWFIARLQPYRGVEDRISGVVLTFVNITERKRLEREILEVSGREQRRIGHDLHDDLCQKLGAIQLLSGVLASDLATEAHPRGSQAERISAQTREATECARLLARGLSPVALNPDGLGAALQELADSSAQRFHLRCEFCSRVAVVALEPGAASHLYRIAQEAIRNAARHGRAKRVTLDLKAAGEGFELKVTDDGRGFVPTVPTSGMGLRIMKYRAALIGASLEVRSAPGAGTVVACAFFADGTHRVRGPKV